MTAWRFTDTVEIVRRVTAVNGTITVLDALEGPFAGQLIRTGRSRGSTDTIGPRRLRSGSNLLRYREGFLGPAGDPLRSGDRVNLEGTDFEILEEPREVHLGRRIIGFEVPILEVTRLYPFTGAIQEQGGTSVKAGVRFAVYSADESHDVTGTYENYASETDLSNHAECKINRQFVSDGRIYKITAAENDLVGGYVRMSVRKSGANE